MLDKGFLLCYIIDSCRNAPNKTRRNEMLKVNKLKAKIIEKETSIEEVSQKMGIDKSTFHRKMKNNSFFVNEVDTIAKELQLTPEETTEIFFAQ